MLTNSPLYDYNCTFVGLICVSSDARDVWEQPGHLHENKESLSTIFSYQIQSNSKEIKSKVGIHHSF